MNDFEVRSMYELCKTNLIFLASHILSDTKPGQRVTHTLFIEMENFDFSSIE
jgi:hypothetical protein